MAAFQTPIPSAILRRSSVEANTGFARSTIYRRIKAGLFPPPVSLGGDRVGWPAKEVDAINQARIAGVEDEGIKALVERLVTERTKTGPVSDFLTANGKPAQT